jgi:hypothetical protein
MGLVLQEADSTTIENCHPSSEGSQEVGVAVEEGSNGIKVVGGAGVWGGQSGCLEKGVAVPLGVQDLESMKKMRYMDAGEGDVVLGVGASVCGRPGELNVGPPGVREDGGGGIEEVGVAEMEAARKKDLYKEAATGQVEPETAQSE